MAGEGVSSSNQGGKKQKSQDSAEKNKAKSMMEAPMEKKMIEETMEMEVDVKGDDDSGNDDNNTETVHLQSERERRKKMRTMFAALRAMLPHLPSKADKTSIVDEAVRCIKILEKTKKNLELKKQEKLLAAARNNGHTNNTNDASDCFIVEHGGLASANVIPTSTKSNLPILNPQYQSGGPSQLPPLPALPAPPVLMPPPPLLALPELPPPPPPRFRTWASPNLVVSINGEQAYFNVCCSKKHCLFTAICLILEKYKIEVLSTNISSEDDYSSMYMLHTFAIRDWIIFPDVFPAEEIFKQAALEIMQWVA